MGQKISGSVAEVSGSIGSSGSDGRYRLVDRNSDAPRPKEREEGESNRSRTETVVRRIKSAFPAKAEAEANKLAWCLSDSESIQRSYFENLFPSGENSTLHVSIFWRDITETTKEKQIWEAFSYFAPQFKYGPYWAAVKLGNVLLQWGTDNVVIPQPAASSVSEEMSVEISGHCNGAPAVATGGKREYLVSPSSFSEEIAVNMDSGRDEKVAALMQTIEKYNTKYHHGLFTCNCQRFVRDILQSLDAEKLVRTFEDCLSHHEQVLVKRGTEVLKEEFNTHAELDNYVRVRMEDMTEEERQFCYGHYILFHLWHTKCPETEAWKCNTATCLYRELKKRL